MNKTITILGFGVSGQAAAKLAKMQGYKVTVFDEGLKTIPAEYDESYKFITTPETPIPESELIVTSPGIPPHSKLMQKAKAPGSLIVSELEFGYRYCNVPILAITGTNGKTTTTELTAHLLSAIGYNAITVGNIGNPICDIVCENLPQKTVLVTEVSSFQLEFPELDDEFTFAPHAAAILNITSDHQDRYASFADYGKTKFRIFNNCQHRIINETLIPDWHQYYQEKPVTFGISQGDWQLKESRIYFNDAMVIDQAKTQMPGLHNAENIMASLALIQALCGNETLNNTKLKNALCEFRTGEHRLELFLEKDGIKYINDSKSTNPDSTIAALKAVGGNHNVCLILGGLDKDMDFTPLLSAAPYIKKAFIIGQCKDKIAKVIEGKIPFECHESLESAAITVKKAAHEGDIVLLSPACASMDMFKNYKDRGEQFKAIYEEN